MMIFPRSKRMAKNVRLPPITVEPGENACDRNITVMKTAIFVLVATLAATPFLRAADIVGIITFKGAPPAEVSLADAGMADNADCLAMHKDIPTTHHYVVGKNGEFGNVIVYLKGMDGKSTGASAAPAVLDQKGCVYAPGILAVQTGQKITVKNSDDCIHNVHAIPTVAGNEEYNDPQQPGSADLTYSFP